jgi:hypothetical protein
MRKIRFSDITIRIIKIGGKMKRVQFLLFAMCFLVLSGLFFACGDGPGSPGSTGSEETGIRILTVSVTKDSPDLDVYQSPDACDGKPESALTAERADLVITAEQLNPGSSFNPFPASVESCTITYKKAVEDPASPIIESLTIFPNCTIANGSNSCNIMVIDIARKWAYWDALSMNGGVSTPREYPTHYIARYNCTYMNNLGKEGSFQTEFDIWLADWLVCGG